MYKGISGHGNLIHTAVPMHNHCLFNTHFLIDMNHDICHFLIVGTDDIGIGMCRIRQGSENIKHCL